MRGGGSGGGGTALPKIYFYIPFAETTEDGTDRVDINGEEMVETATVMALSKSRRPLPK